MIIERCFGRLALSMRAASIGLACALVLTGFAYSVHATVAQASPLAAQLARPPHAGTGSAAFKRDGGSRAAIALEEQSLPPEELASPAASPAAPGVSPSPAAPAVPSATGPGSQAPAVANPPAQASPNDEGAGGWTRVPASAGGPAASGGGVPESGAAAGAPAAPAGAPAAGEPAPAGTPTEAPPPYDVGSVQPTAPVSDQPLTGLIDATKDQPALNASLRVAEEGRKALEASRLDDAIRDFGRAISIDPTDPYAYFYLGRAYMMKKNYPQALAFFGRSEVGVRAVPAWLGEVKGFEGACLEEQGKFPEAAIAYKQALDVAPGNLMARTGYGRLSASLTDANAGNAPPPPPPADGAALPAPEVNLAAPAPSEAPPPTAAGPDKSDSGDDPGMDSNTDSGDDSSGDATGQSGASGGQNDGPGAQGNQ